MRKVLLLILVALVSAGCRKTQPQIPSYKSGRAVVADSALLQALEMNRRLAEEADRQLSRYAAEGYAMTESGYWAKGLRDTGNRLQEGENVEVHLRVLALDSSLIEDMRSTLTIGKEQLPEAATDALRQMARGEKVSLAVPWYLAFGSTGTDHVPPYTNVLIEIETAP